MNVFDNDEDDDNDDGIMGKEDNVDVNSNKGGSQFVARCLSGRDFVGKYFDVRMVSTYKLIYSN